jgi:phosphoribosylanthranilate isomerase
MIIKVCGITELVNALNVANTGINILGLIFYPQSKRFVIDNKLGKKIKSENNRISLCGVFVNPTYEEVKNKITQHHLDYIQIYDISDDSILKNLKQSNPNIKIISAHSFYEIKNINFAKNEIDYLLIDSANPKADGQYGGTGVTFNWAEIDKLQITKPFFISGGVSIENISEIENIKSSYFYGIDLNSKFEIKPGIKNPEIINNALLKIKNYESR